MNFIDCQKNLELELEFRAQDIMNIADEEVDTWWHLNQLKTIGTYEPSYNIGLLDCLSTFLKVSHKKKESWREHQISIYWYYCHCVFLSLSLPFFHSLSLFRSKSFFLLRRINSSESVWFQFRNQWGKGNWFSFDFARWWGRVSAWLVSQTRCIK